MSLNFEELMLENQRLSTENVPGQGFGLDQYVKMPEGNGTVVIRILPWIPHPTKRNKDGNPVSFLYQETRTHKINGRNVHCRRELVNGKWVGECPVCEYINWLWRQVESLQRAGRTDESERRKAEARDLKAIERYYYPVIVRKEQQSNGDVKENVGPKIYSCGKTVQARIIRAICGDMSVDEIGLGDITDAAKGRDFKVVKRVKGGPDSFPEYNDSKFLDPSPLGDPDKVDKWLSARPDLTSYRKVLSIDELEFEVDVYRGVKADTRNHSRYDEVPTGNGCTVGGAAAVVHAAGGDDDDAPAPTMTAAPVAAAVSAAVSAAPAVEESAALGEEDFIKRLKAI